MGFDDLLKYATSDKAVISLLVGFAWALITERIVSGRAYRALQRRCDRWEEIALDGLGITRKVTRHLEARRPQAERETDDDGVAP